MIKRPKEQNLTLLREDGGMGPEAETESSTKSRDRKKKIRTSVRRDKDLQTYAAGALGKRIGPKKYLQ